MAGRSEAGIRDRSSCADHMQTNGCEEVIPRISSTPATYFRKKADKSEWHTASAARRTPAESGKNFPGFANVRFIHWKDIPQTTQSPGWHRETARIKRDSQQFSLVVVGDTPLRLGGSRDTFRARRPDWILPPTGSDERAGFPSTAICSPSLSKEPRSSRSPARNRMMSSTVVVTPSLNHNDLVVVLLGVVDGLERLRANSLHVPEMKNSWAVTSSSAWGLSLRSCAFRSMAVEYACSIPPPPGRARKVVKEQVTLEKVDRPSRWSPPRRSAACPPRSSPCRSPTCQRPLPQR